MRERILFVGKPGAMGRDIAEAIISLGHDCCVFEQCGGITYRKALRGASRRFGFFSSLRRWDDRRMNRTLLRTARKFKPTILLVWNGDAIAPETVRAIQSMGATTANWFLDLMTHWDIIRRVAPDYQWFFTPDRRVIRELSGAGVTAHLCPFGYARTYPSFPEGEREYPISFVGSYHPNIWRKREEFLLSVANLGVHIWGPTAWKNSRLQKQYRGEARGAAMMDIYRRSRIVVDIPWDHIPSDAISIRPYEAAAAGACLFFYDIRPDMHNLFVPGKEYVPFTTADDLLEKASRFLTHPDELGQIARAGYARFMREHTYEARLSSMIEEMRATVSESS